MVIVASVVIVPVVVVIVASISVVASASGIIRIHLGERPVLVEVQFNGIGEVDLISLLGVPSLVGGGCNCFVGEVGLNVLQDSIRQVVGVDHGFVAIIAPVCAVAVIVIGEIGDAVAGG